MARHILQVTDEMRQLAKELAERAAGYDRAQKTMGNINWRRSFGLCSNSGYLNTVQQHDTAVRFYKELSQPFYAAAKAANSDLFSGNLQQDLQAERALKVMLNDYVTKVAAQEGLPPSNFYFYTTTSTAR